MKKDLLAILAIIFIIVLLVVGVDIQSVDDYYLTHIDDITEDSETVFLSINCSTILDNWDKLHPSLRSEKYVPKNGVILARSEYVLRKGDNVYDILDRAVRHNRIQMESSFTGQFDSVYVEGINHLYEFSCGELSGWMYKVNGEFPLFGSSKFKLRDGDTIEWVYTCDLGRDVGNIWGGSQQ